VTALTVELTELVVLLDVVDKAPKTEVEVDDPDPVGVTMTVCNGSVVDAAAPAPTGAASAPTSKAAEAAPSVFRRRPKAQETDMRRSLRSLEDNDTHGRDFAW
jgi:hypothetical protein